MTKKSLRFEEMLEKEFDIYFSVTLNYYVSGKSKAFDITFEQCKKAVQKEVTNLLPAGFKTPDNHFFNVVDEDDTLIGHVWIKIKNEFEEARAYLCDIVILEKFRHQGFGSQIMSMVEEFCIENKAKDLRFHVFDHNLAAKKLYAKCGYEPYSIMMKKRL